MHRYILSAAIVCIAALNMNAQPYQVPTGVHRILFLGNSITYAGNYVSYIDTYLALQYPGNPYEILNLGLPSETVSGLSEPNHAGGRFPRPDLHERLSRILTLAKPDLVFACYGMNDGIYLPFSDERFAAFRNGIQWLHDQLAAAHVPIIHLTPPIFDERKGAAYANVLDIYSDWLISKRYTSDWQVIDVHGAMKQSLADRRMVDTGFVFATDGVHPDSNGHWIIARAVLNGMGETKLQKIENFSDAIAAYPNAKTVRALIEEKQAMLKDAWLSYTRHTRPEMPAGIPVSQAWERQSAIDRKVILLTRHP